MKNITDQYFRGFCLSGPVEKESACYAGDAADGSSIPGSGRSPEVGNSNTLQYSCLENPMDREARRATVHGFTKESDMTEHTHSHRQGNLYLTSRIQGLSFFLCLAPQSQHFLILNPLFYPLSILCRPIPQWLSVFGSSLGLEMDIWAFCLLWPLPSVSVTVLKQPHLQQISGVKWPLLLVPRKLPVGIRPQWHSRKENHSVRERMLLPTNKTCIRSTFLPQ